MKKILLLVTVAISMIQIANAQCSELFISEYMEGTGNNKAIEIYNPTNNPISLANYRLVRHDNGNSNTLEPIDPQHVLNLPSNITMPPNTVYVMALNLTDPNGTGQSAPIDLELQAVADTLLCNGCGTTAGNSRVLCFNGDDALALQKKNGDTWTNIDIFACIGEQPLNNNGTASPTAGWTILPPYSSMPADFTPPGAYFLQYWTQDKTLLRKFEVATGVTVNPPVQSFNPSVQWDSLPTNTFYELGRHQCSCGCTDYNNVIVDFAGSAIACPGATVSVTATLNGLPGTPSLSYSWSNGTNGQTASLPVGTHTVTITEASGCKKTSSVTINPAPAPVNTVSFQAPSICGAQDGNVSVSLSGGTPPFQYSWTSNGSTNDTLFNIGAGSYQCQITDASNCVFPIFATIQDPGAPTITVDNTTLATCDTCQNGSINISTSASANATYNWTLNGTTVGTTQDLANVNPGTYTLTLLENGCSNSIVVIVGNSVGINEIKNTLNVYAFPNPANNHLSIFSNELIKSVTIYSLTGAIEHEVLVSATSQKLALDITDLHSGVHFAKITDSKGNTRTVKFIKQ